MTHVELSAHQVRLHRFYKLPQAEKVLRELIDMLRVRPSLGASDIRSALRIAGAEPKANGAGKLVIAYSSLEQLDGILAKLR